MGDADRLPMTNVTRIVAAALPKDASVSKEARVALSACATVFVHYITELAVQSCDKRKKVTLTPEDILDAIREAEFEDFDEPLQASLQAYRAQEKAAKKPSAKKQKTDAGDNAAGGGGEAELEDAANMDGAEKAVEAGESQ